MENRKTCRNAQCFCDGSCQDLIKSDINYTSVIPMENKTAEEILKEFENFCGNLAVSGDSPSSDTIKQYFDEYASQKLAEKDKEIERLKLSQIRQSLVWFAGKMEEKLKKNEHKGGWDNCEIDWLIKRLKEEVIELENSWLTKKNDFGRSAGEGFLLCPSNEDIQNECADVANFSMMIADKIESLNK